MAVEDSVKGKTEGPFVQFEDCSKLDNKCNFRNETGKCIFETCMYENELPPTTKIWDFKCVLCGKIEHIDPRIRKVPFCNSCIARAIAAEKKPFSCVFCGSSQNHNSKIFLSGICDACFGLMDAAMHCGHCGR